MKKEWKADHSPVTETDHAINAIVLKEIQRKFPKHSILSEEGNAVKESEYVWICDPVDGTHNFAHGIPTVTFALALIKSGVPIVSVINDPFMNRLFTAEKGKGAYLNGKRIHVSNDPLIKRTMIGMGKMNEVRNLIPVFERARHYGARIVTGLSIHYMCMLVACGEFSAAFFGGASPHDISASALLVSEAGGKATDLFGKVPKYYEKEMDGQIVSNGRVHDELMTLFMEA